MIAASLPQALEVEVAVAEMMEMVIAEDDLGSPVHLSQNWQNELGLEQGRGLLPLGWGQGRGPGP